MKNKLILFFWGIVAACDLTSCQVYNSSSGDATKYSNSPQAVLQRHCSSCHNFANQTEDELMAQGLVVRGNLAASPLFSRIRGSGVGGSEDMPPPGSSGGDVSTEELGVLTDWIQRL